VLADRPGRITGKKPEPRLQTIRAARKNQERSMLILNPRIEKSWKLLVNMGAAALKPVATERVLLIDGDAALKSEVLKY
jgi:hypothetical protein